MNRAKLLAAVVALSLLAGPSAWAAIHDDILIDYVRVSTDGALGNSGNAVTFANNGGPFWAVMLRDDRGLTQRWQKPLDPLLMRDLDSAHSGYGIGTTPHWVNAENRNGSPYTAVVDRFFTFCVETNQTFSPGTVYDIRDLSGTSWNTTKAMTGYAAWVFDKFQQNVVSLNPRAPNDTQKAKLATYQKAIWAGMVGFTDTNTDSVWQTSEALGEVGGGTSQYHVKFGLDWDSDADEYSTAGILYSAFLLDATNWAWAGANEYDMLRRFNGYQLINVQTDSAGQAQDQMIAYGGPTGGVPEPATIVVWSLLAGAAGVAALRRRREPTRRC